MCGLFGFQTTSSSNLNLRKLTETLLKISQERGKDASGLSTKFDKKNIIFKLPVSGEDLCKTKIFNNLFKEINNSKNKSISLIGQCRLTTTGHKFIDKFNQPVLQKNISLIHNGIITNIVDLYNKSENKDDAITNVSDTYLLAGLLSKLKHDNNNFNDIFLDIQKKIKGS